MHHGNNKGINSRNDYQNSNTGRIDKKSRARRVTKACDHCRTIRRRCDGAQPSCRECEGRGLDCSYEAFSRKRGTPAGYILALESILSWLVERVPGNLEALGGHPKQQHRHQDQQRQDAGGQQEEETHPWPTKEGQSLRRWWKRSQLLNDMRSYGGGDLAFSPPPLLHNRPNAPSGSGGNGSSDWSKNTGQQQQQQQHHNHDVEVTRWPLL